MTLSDRLAVIYAGKIRRAPGQSIYQRGIKHVYDGAGENRAGDGIVVRKIKKKRISLDPKEYVAMAGLFSGSVLLAILISCVFLELFGFSA